ncbi:MAG: SWIM zinc finger domain-containing protein, partial [Hominisplanchenecus sp.]
MADWEQKFDQDTLDRGRASYLNHRVDGLEETDGGCRGAVLGRQRFEVSVKLREGSPVRMSCSCPAAKCGRNCEHMAAVLYALEAKRKAWEEQIQEAELMKKWRQMDEELRLEEEKKKAEKQNSRDERHRKAMTKRRLKEEKEAEERRRLEEEQMAEARRIQEEKEAEARRIQEEKEAELR